MNESFCTSASYIIKDDWKGVNDGEFEEQKITTSHTAGMFTKQDLILEKFPRNIQPSLNIIFKHDLANNIPVGSCISKF